MQECSVLSSGSSNAMLVGMRPRVIGVPCCFGVQVLPQTPLMEIVRKHKAQQATGGL